MWSELRYRLRALFRRDDMERELAQELQFHLDRQAETRPRDARAGFGGVEQIKEQCRDERGVGLIDRASQDLRYAWRMLARRPAFTTAVVTTLALGIGGATTMFAVVDGVLLKPLPYADADRIVRVGRSFGGVRVTAISPVDYAAIASHGQAVSRIAIARTEAVDVAVPPAAPQRLEAAAVSASYFEVLGVAPALGQTLSPGDDKPGGRAVAVISHRLSERFENITDVVVNGQPHTVIGVMPRRFRGPEALGHENVDLWLPLGRLRLSVDPDDASLGAIAKLKKGAPMDAAAAELTAIGAGRNAWIAPLRSETVGTSGSGLWLLFGGVSLLLLLACTNIAHLFLVRATERTRELAVRTAMGAGSGRIARQLVTETLCFSLAGGLLGALLAYGGVHLVRLWAPTDLPRVGDLQVDVRVLLFAFGSATLAGITFGAGPALHVRRSNFAGLLRGSSAGLTTSRAHQHIRAILITLQTAMAVMLVTGASILATTVWRLSHVNPGFDPSNVIWLDVSLPERAYTGAPPKIAFFTEVLSRARTAREIQAVSVIQGRPLGGGNAVATVAPEGRLSTQDERTPRVPFHVVAPGYFATMRIPHLDGRDFHDADRMEGPRVAIVSRAFAERFWPGERAVGKRFWMGRVAADAPLTEIVGVVEDVRQYALASPPMPMVYRALAQVPRGTATIVARHDGSGSQAALARLRSSVQTLDSALSLDRAGTMDAQLSSSIREPRFRAMVLSAFSLVACMIACIGLHGSLALLVRARRRELAVRLAVGAQTSRLRALIVRRGLLLAGAGTALGLGGAAAAARSIASLTFGVASLDLQTSVLAAAAMLLVALIASWIPAQRAARISPIELLKD